MIPGRAGEEAAELGMRRKGKAAWCRRTTQKAAPVPSELGADPSPPSPTCRGRIPFDSAQGRRDDTLEDNTRLSAD